MITITNEDNMELMARYPDNYFDLAIVDPPYGIDIAEWDEIDMKPKDEYFKELFRVSKNQIIWGANYFHLPHSQAWICWHKTAGFTKRVFSGASDFELAWCSFDSKARLIPLTCSGNIIGINGGKPNYKYKPIHPTQKPVELYTIILEDYAKQGDKILDTHLGSGSIAIACHDYKFDLTACELDKEYFDKAMLRLKEHQSQLKMF
jgi:site-specific DNA-methyltransferase (adenine-specific)